VHDRDRDEVEKHRQDGDPKQRRGLHHSSSPRPFSEQNVVSRSTDFVSS
jgi:hypothetical protein